ncbi:hypothetical protein QWY28_22710 [Nocardioides sp. SOB77]|uniref:Uncharacterized protein n=1 Tax=Nocardioides oceani TaxID=3058369 RepID=A0ABT8FMP4_9ACTN|nr:hypothetical protein [Nocardioides oceani]MDN4175790.1 hypothetical protein [Nocardioides oceani]
MFRARSLTLRRQSRGDGGTDVGLQRAQRDIDRQLRAWGRRRLASWTLMGGGILVALQHLVAHAGTQPLPMSMAAQDIFLGYPSALILVLVGALLADPHPRL